MSGEKLAFAKRYAKDEQPVETGKTHAIHTCACDGHTTPGEVSGIRRDTHGEVTVTWFSHHPHASGTSWARITQVGDPLEDYTYLADDGTHVVRNYEMERSPEVAPYVETLHRAQDAAANAQVELIEATASYAQAVRKFEASQNPEQVPDFMELLLETSAETDLSRNPEIVLDAFTQGHLERWLERRMDDTRDRDRVMILDALKEDPELLARGFGWTEILERGSV